MESTRQNKVSKQLQKDLGELLQTLGAGIVPGKMISVTVVRVSPDLGLAKVYLSVFPSKDAKEAVKAIDAKAATFRYELGKRVKNQLRVVPELHFYLDDSLDYVENIENLLKE